MNTRSYINNIKIASGATLALSFAQLIIFINQWHNESKDSDPSTPHEHITAYIFSFRFIMLAMACYTLYQLSGAETLLSTHEMERQQLANAQAENQQERVEFLQEKETIHETLSRELAQLKIDQDKVTADKAALVKRNNELEENERQLTRSITNEVDSQLAIMQTSDPTLEGRIAQVRALETQANASALIQLLQQHQRHIDMTLSSQTNNIRHLLSQIMPILQEATISTQQVTVMQGRLLQEALAGAHRATVQAQEHSQASSQSAIASSARLAAQGFNLAGYTTHQMQTLATNAINAQAEATREREETERQRIRWDGRSALALFQKFGVAVTPRRAAPSATPAATPTPTPTATASKARK